MRIRNIITLIVAFAIMIALVMGMNIKNNRRMSSDSWGKASEGFRLSVHIKNKEFKLGEPILLKLTIQNVTDQVLYLTETNPESDYKIVVRNEHGEDMPLTEPGKRLANNKEEFRVIGIKVNAGEERQDNIEVTRLQEITVPGTYSITASRMVKNRSGKGWSEVISNTINVTVAP